jgi:YbgC/YbaW family acyl-CoA thioester hydrolase
MFETRLQTYWADADAAGQVFFPHFFRFVECAEEDLFRAAGIERNDLYDQHQVIMPRVESFAKFTKPIRVGEAVFIQIRTRFKGEKTVRLEFTFLNGRDRSLLAEGYVTAVCVDRRISKSRAMPPAVREVYARAATND